MKVGIYICGYSGVCPVHRHWYPTERNGLANPRSCPHVVFFHREFSRSCRSFSKSSIVTRLAVRRLSITFTSVASLLVTVQKEIGWYYNAKFNANHAVYHSIYHETESPGIWKASSVFFFFFVLLSLFLFSGFGVNFIGAP